MSIGNVAGSIGRGLLAGVIGTGVMTLAQMIQDEGAPSWAEHRARQGGRDGARDRAAQRRGRAKAQSISLGAHEPSLGGPAERAPGKRRPTHVRQVLLTRGSDAQLTHFAYGTAWGLTRGLLGSAGVRATAANSLHLLLVWGAALAMLPRMGLAPPVREWSKTELVEDLGMHAVYALATGTAYEWLERRS